MIKINNQIYDIEYYTYELKFLPKPQTFISIIFKNNIEEIYQNILLLKNKEIEISSNNIFYKKSILNWIFYSKENNQITLLLKEEK